MSAALDLVPVPHHPFDFEEYLRRVEAARGRRVYLHDLPAAAVGAICGLWIATAGGDHIFVAPGAVGLLRVNILLHEISHMLLGHGKVTGDVGAALTQLLNGGGQAEGVLARSRYDTHEERHAEMLAALILTRASQPEQAGQGDELSMLGDVMGYPMGGDRA
ncbi:hypothetical protein [Streptosporangium sp. NPDC002524]|uniref:hypothetical protein n=1 Tax=Streptosporangium sp. NPDC002524 TaxID=3154537 RepID=UPI0033243B28